ncbi:hypothetical protein BDZ91DRAFT_829147 [Kalaharituber pfeilii]|nr:hypothetical protein BDZ91DRAFT_829147 [Kalaharituber pfeilii]
MNPFLSWLIFLAVAGAAYYVYAKPTLPWDAKRQVEQVIVTKGGAIHLVEEKAEKERKKKKKTEKTPKPQPVPQPKIVPSSDGDSENDVEEEDQKEAIKRLHALKSGISLEPTRGRKSATQKQNLAAPANTSRASSTGADADIDEKESSKRASSSDPTTGPAGAQCHTLNPAPPEKKAKTTSVTPEPGAQSKKNKKKKEKAKQAREEELHELNLARERHRAAQKAEESSRQKNTPPPPVQSAWTAKSSSPAPKPTSGGADADLLDTSDNPAPASGSDRSEEEAQTHSSYLDQSQWEEIPSHVREENEWSTVSSKKSKDRSKLKQSATSESEVPAKEAGKAPTRPVVSASTPAMIRGKSSNGFEALSDDAATTRSSDWAEVDGWEVHPSS